LPQCIIAPPCRLAKPSDEWIFRFIFTDYQRRHRSVRDKCAHLPIRRRAQVAGNPLNCGHVCSARTSRIPRAQGRREQRDANEGKRSRRRGPCYLNRTDALFRPPALAGE
jgi:hypothetical protein